MNKSAIIQEVTFLLEKIPEENMLKASEAIKQLIKRLDSMTPSMSDEEFMAMLATAPEDDEEETEEERLAVVEAYEDIKAARVIPIEDLLMEQGL